MRLVGLMLALAVALTPPFAEAQQTTKVYRIGFLGLSSATDYAPYLESFPEGCVILVTKKEGIS
jgi:hypothetical protein